MFFFVDNFYAMGGQTAGETMGYDLLSRIGGGVNAENMIERGEALASAR